MRQRQIMVSNTRWCFFQQKVQHLQCLFSIFARFLNKAHSSSSMVLVNYEMLVESQQIEEEEEESGQEDAGI
jgi:hypothetical protein